MIIYILGIAAVAVLQVPLFSHGPMCVNIICWAVWGALFFAAYYLDKKIPERKLRYSNPWIEGVFSVIYFLCYMLWFALGDNCCWIDCGGLCESFFGKKKEEKCCLMRLKQ